MEKGAPNDHPQPVSPMKRVLLRNIPELGQEFDPVVNAFDPWARDRRAVQQPMLEASSWN